MGSLRVDASQWPIVVFAVEGTADVAVIGQVTAEFQRLCRRGEPFINVFDLRMMDSMPANARSQFTADAKANAGLYSQYVVTAICVVPSRVIRGVLTAMQWVFSFPHPVEPVPDEAAAIRLVRERGRQRELSLPADFSISSVHAA